MKLCDVYIEKYKLVKLLNIMIKKQPLHFTKGVE
jgi:hypothetical protein